MIRPSCPISCPVRSCRSQLDARIDYRLGNCQIHTFEFKVNLFLALDNVARKSKISFQPFKETTFQKKENFANLIGSPIFLISLNSNQELIAFPLHQSGNSARQIFSEFWELSKFDLNFHFSLIEIELTHHPLFDNNNHVIVKRPLSY